MTATRRRPLRREALREALLARGLTRGETAGLLRIWRARYQALPPGDERAACLREGLALRALADALDGERVPTEAAERGLEVLGALSIAVRLPEEIGGGIAEHAGSGLEGALIYARRDGERLVVEDAISGEVRWQGPPAGALSPAAFAGLPAVEGRS